MAVLKYLLAAFVVLFVLVHFLSNVVRAKLNKEEDAQPSNNKLNSLAIETSCCKQYADDRYLLLLSTLDGHITALDVRNEGQIVWSLPTDAQPLFSSTLGKIEFPYGDSVVRLIPSLDGNFYMYNDAIAQGIPMSAETLLSNSMKFGNDIISGGKDIRTFGVNYNSGELHYMFTLNNRENYANEIVDNLVIRRVTQTVRAVEATTGAERWNVTVGEHELLLTSRESATCFCPTNYMQEEEMERSPLTHSDKSYQFRIKPAEGLVVAFHKSDPYSPVWQTKLDTPIAQLWKLNENRVEEISLFDSNVVPYLPSFAYQDASNMVIYVGTYENEKYVIPSPEEKERLKFMVAQRNFLPPEPGRLFLAADPGDNDENLLTDEYNTNKNCFETCPTCSSEEVNALILRDQYPKDMGWYLFKHHDKSVPPLSNSNRRNLPNKSDSFATERFLFRWRDVLLMLMMPVCFVSIFVCYSVKKYRALRNCIIVKDASAHETTSTVTMVNVKSQASETDLNLEPAAIPSEFTSWYLDHFEPLRCLGKGGFGVVMESLNKLDQQKYAVKRIRVSNKPDGKERVQREVRALAKLDHPGIVRYYSTWLEEPPPNWQETWDREYLKRCELNPNLSVDVPWSVTTGDVVGGAGDHIAKNLANPFLNSTKNNELSLSAIMNKKLGLDFSSIDFDVGLASSSINSNLSSVNDENKNEKLTKNNKNYSDDDGSLEIVFADNDDENIQKTRSFENNTSSKFSSSSSSTREIIKEKIKGITLDTADKQLQTSNNVNNPTSAFLYIQMQLCQDQTLSKWMRDHRSLDDRDRGLVLDWFDQIVCAVQYVHDSNLIHRDLKPSNIFFAQNGQLKIGDFGLAKGFVMNEVDSDEPSTTLHRSVSHTDNVGTWLYMSPEQEHGDSYTFKVDTYALGLIFVELLLPFSTEMERRNVLKDLKCLKFPKHFDVDFVEEHELAKCLLSHDPDQRPTCKKIRESPLFACFLPVRPLSTNGGLSTSRNYSRESQNSVSGSGDS